MHIQTRAGRRRAAHTGEDVMSVIENNGEVTLPGAGRDPLKTRRQVISAVMFAATLAALAFIALASR